MGPPRRAQSAGAKPQPPQGPQQRPRQNKRHKPDRRQQARPHDHSAAALWSGVQPVRQTQAQGPGHDPLNADQTGQPRSADATALGPTSGVVLQRGSFLRVVSSRAELGLALARHLSPLLRDTNYQMESIALYDLQARVARFLLLALRREYGTAIPAEAPLTLWLNQAELAAVLGASRPKINQVLQAMLAEGLLRRDGAELICNRARLEGFAGIDASDEPS